MTRNTTKALSVLMVDFSCALKLAMPVTVLSAIREANTYGITVKGGKFLEKVAAANTIVFDKTGTLTEATPTVHSVMSFCDKTPDELLRIAACLEEHFPHSIANAVVRAAAEKGLKHDEMHTKVEYVVAHGVKSTLDGAEVLIGSYHFIFEDMGSAVPLGTEKKLLAIYQASFQDCICQSTAGLRRSFALKIRSARKRLQLSGSSKNLALTISL